MRQSFNAFCADMYNLQPNNYTDKEKGWFFESWTCVCWWGGGGGGEGGREGGLILFLGEYVLATLETCSFRLDLKN